MDFFLPVQHRSGQIYIGRTTFDNPAVQGQVGSLAGQPSFVAAGRIPAILDKNAGVRFKDRCHIVAAATLLAGTNFRWDHPFIVSAYWNFPRPDRQRICARASVWPVRDTAISVI
jgi:hypothetical protein